MMARSRERPASLLLAVLLLSSCAWLACGGETEGEIAELPDASLDELEGLDGLDDPDGATKTLKRHGRYRKRHATAELAAEVDAAEIEQLAAIGYLDGTKAAHSQQGVTRHDPARSAGGFNLYVSADAPKALLMDMQGRTVHHWALPASKIWRGPKLDRKGAHYFRRAYLLEDGGLLVIFEGLGIAKIDVDSKVLWATPAEGKEGPVGHHDVEVQPNGDLLALTRTPRIIPWLNPKKLILDDFITLYSGDGEKKFEISLAEAFGRSDYRKVLLGNKRKKGDIFHSNSIHMLDGSVAHVNPSFDPGNVLISIRHLNMLAVLDPGQRKIVWASRGTFKLQHDAAVLANGNILLFDNGAKNTQDSRAVELDPATLETRWEYRGTEQDPLWSKTCGTVQRLPDGNTLIVESDNGRAIEITPDGEIIWEWLSPHRAGNDPDLVATLFDLIRLPPETYPFVSR